MQLHQLKPIHKFKKHKRVGRGGKKGTYSGKGQKGQKSRAGKGRRPTFAGGSTPLFKRFPKLRGAKKVLDIRHGVKGIRYKNYYSIINVKDLEKKFESSAKINPETLFKSGLVKKTGKKMPNIKILGDGELTKKFEISGCKLSKSASEKIKKAGGSIK